jgi:hypothetical protein
MDDVTVCPHTLVKEAGLENRISFGVVQSVIRLKIYI